MVKKLTPRQAAIVSAQTGVLIGKFSTFHAYAEKLVGEQIPSSAFARVAMERLLVKLSKKDFIAISPD